MKLYRSRAGQEQSGGISILSWRALLAAVACFAAIVGVTACGSSSSSSTSSASGGSDSASEDKVVAEAEANVEAASKDVTSGVPTSSPPAVKNKSVVLIPCAAAAQGCSEPIAGAEEAAKVLGWETRQIDGKGTVADQIAAIDQAIALKPDAIIMHAIDPSTVTGALKRAKSAGIPVIISSTAEKDSPLAAFSNSPTYDLWVKTGELAADYIIAATKGKAQYISLTNAEFGVDKPRTEGFESEMSKCTGCKELGSTSYRFASMANELPQATQQLMQANPDANVVFVQFDAAVPFVLQGLQTIGQHPIVVSGDGVAQQLTCIHEGCGQTATAAIPVRWIGWTDIDATNRIFSGEDPSPASVGLPVKLMTEENAPDGDWKGDIDYPAQYAELWNTTGK